MLVVDFFDVFDNTVYVACKAKHNIKIIVFFANLAVFKYLVSLKAVTSYKLIACKNIVCLHTALLKLCHYFFGTQAHSVKHYRLVALFKVIPYVLFVYQFKHCISPCT